MTVMTIAGERQVHLTSHAPAVILTFIYSMSSQQAHTASVSNVSLYLQQEGGGLLARWWLEGVPSTLKGLLQHFAAFQILNIKETKHASHSTLGHIFVIAVAFNA